MRISETVLRRYHLALQTRGFVILAGLSGSGKTWLTQLYARAIGARYKLVPVAPNWTTNEDLLGYFNPLAQQYHDTAFSRFLREASAEFERATEKGEDPVPYHVALDEMNLARVEYYFAQFLSAMEIRARQGSAEVDLGPDDTVLLPPNLFFIGTVNIDETTHGFANKVYDRAQLIELEAPRSLLAEHIGDASWAHSLLTVWDAVADVAPFAFRVLDEVESYVSAAEDLGIDWSEALDEQVVQKVLPKLKGADPRIGEALESLAALAGEKLPRTHSKAQAMHRALIEYGFTSYF
jgi:MoxR-like ATPase